MDYRLFKRVRPQAVILLAKPREHERTDHPRLVVSERDAPEAMLMGQKLHERFMMELELVHVQLDGLWANIKDG
jgi:hypothetical protein